MQFHPRPDFQALSLGVFVLLSSMLCVFQISGPCLPKPALPNSELQLQARYSTEASPELGGIQHCILVGDLEAASKT